MYGFDILLDSNIKPWLIEINASPSLSTTTKKDKELKLNLINDVYRIVLPEESNESDAQRSNY
jgi:tubulin polyglutamylase TTLL1